MMTFDLKRMFRWLGGITAAVSAILTFNFGSSYAWYVAVGLVMASLGNGYVWPFLRDAYNDRNWGMLGFAALGATVFFATDVTTNFGSITWKRGVDIEAAKLQNARYDDGRQTIADLEGKKALLESRLAKLEVTEGWSGMKPSAAYDGEIVAQKEAVRQEEADGGCWTKCLAKKRVLAELEANKAVALAHEQDKAMLASTIAALEKVRKQESKVETAQSAAFMQNTSLASMFTLSMQPSADAMHWTDKGINWMVALFFVVAPAIFNFLGFESTTDSPRARPRAKAGAQREDAPSVPQVSRAPLLEQMEAPKPLSVAKVIPAPQAPAQERGEIHVHMSGDNGKQDNASLLRTIQERLQRGDFKFA
jgi:hypothetical protein